ncbi:STAS domain-containing protein [Leptospira noguchii]|uniref:STAS domain protein n=1 Tax=Leptospira noguchii serovar Panama str. CZ214 TaxID=1001595 RepID=T0FRM6_9LEPT|nr:STAS domain-containing protein [Leptospira noguchii]EQA72904.1 STAS domain protein [Leptospira noguchii serovar Panama str. CZ214]
MEIRSRLSENILKLKLRGRLDSASAEDFYSYLKSKWEEGIRKFLFSCEELEYIESEGIEVLARFENFLKNRGASSAYCAFNEECKTLLSFLGFGRSISFFEDLNRAEEYLSSIKILDQTSSVSSTSKIQKNSPVQFYSSSSSRKNETSRGIFIPEIKTVPEVESESKELKSEAIGTFGLASQSQRLQAFLNEEDISQKEKEFYTVDNSFSKSSSKIETETSSLKSEPSSQLEETSDIEIKSISNQTSQEYSAKSVLEKAIQAEKSFPKKTIYCGACSSRIRVSKPGRYQCPVCQIQFDLNSMDGVRYLEKLLGT